MFQEYKRWIIPGGVSALILLILLLMWGLPHWNVWRREMLGKAQLAEAEWNRKIKIQEAEASFEAAKQLASAEVERAKGVAEANKIIRNGLTGEGGENYIRYLWVQGLAAQDNLTVVYVPTEANLPILEAIRLHQLAVRKKAQAGDPGENPDGPGDLDGTKGAQ